MLMVAAGEAAETMVHRRLIRFGVPLKLVTAHNAQNRCRLSGLRRLDGCFRRWISVGMLYCSAVISRAVDVRPSECVGVGY